ncbi:hypothetical protein NCCP2716_13710 [Sporosarcina sp. NCCP-2716]|uniref:DUF4309 domain-containing protein n=1 Tax=Sporosarcina sp. NCCP-2716 TaxID=2943679 RepID=UPI00203C5939|nr:DUF4309 domain-containing protein [Sporosarcina sp. NCCP-2716]GKV68873.1 hypothetical protein NCCP2716_13710 [Sporosarcina sp. NCCP-2716]
MKRHAALAAVLLAGSLSACSSATEGNPDQGSANGKPAIENAPGSEENSNTAGSADSGSSGTGTEGQQPGDSSASGSQGNEESDGSSGNGESTDANTDSTDVDQEQKQMAIDALNGLVADAKKGKVYRLSDKFYVGKTTQTDVYNEIGQPERQDTFDRYTGSMGQASYDLRYDKNGLLTEARYLGTNVERQTNLGGITSEDIVKQLGQPGTKRPLPEMKQVSFIYDIGNFQLQFVLNDKDTTDHVNLLLR